MLHLVKERVALIEIRLRICCKLVQNHQTHLANVLCICGDLWTKQKFTLYVNKSLTGNNRKKLVIIFIPMLKIFFSFFAYYDKLDRWVFDPFLLMSTTWHLVFIISLTQHWLCCEWKEIEVYIYDLLTLFFDCKCKCLVNVVEGVFIFFFLIFKEVLFLNLIRKKCLDVILKYDLAN